MYYHKFKNIQRITIEKKINKLKENGTSIRFNLLKTNRYTFSLNQIKLSNYCKFIIYKKIQKTTKKNKTSLFNISFESVENCCIKLKRVRMKSKYLKTIFIVFERNIKNNEYEIKIGGKRIQQGINEIRINPYYSFVFRNDKNLKLKYIYLQWSCNTSNSLKI